MILPGRWRPRVYTTLFVVLVLVALGWWGTFPKARGQIDVTVDPAMTKGTVTARVTIFEFSDYE